MEKETRNVIERATQRARKLLEEDFAAQLEGDFDVQREGKVAAKAGSHLSAQQAYQRERIVAAIEHKRAAGMSEAEAVRDYLRDAAFTALNRFVALKMLEARDLVQECVTKGEQSGGYREFYGMAPGLPLLPDSAGYRLYIESIFDELSTEVKVLFDRRDPSSVLWPKRATFEGLLEILNGSELAGVWGEDETIGWVYQFFNGQDERKKMREESQAPRNSRELAVRNQFFTPRYVVQFLTDNTLGRIWYEMRGTETVLAKRCEYMVRKPDEAFAPRPKKDPRDLRILDPACGSGHFLLYAFDLLLAIYEEAYADPASPKSEATGKTLAEDYPSLDAVKKAVPGLVLAHNLHGVDIDPRCAQIAQLALWMRAQKAYRDFGIGRGERAEIRRSNIVVAEPLVADEQIAKEFVAKLGDAELGRVFTSLVESLSLAGDLGLLLRVDQLVDRQATRGQTGDLFAPPEARIRAALERFVLDEAGATNTRRRLFADDVTHGVGLMGVAAKRFDVVLMNPPFGDSSPASRSYLKREYESSKADIAMAFVERAVELCSGRVGALTTRTFLFNDSLEALRRSHFLGGRHAVLAALADLGYGVLDGAMVETAAYVQSAAPYGPILAAFINGLSTKDKAEAVADPSLVTWRQLDFFSHLPGAVICHWVNEKLLASIRAMPTISDTGSSARVGLQTGDNYRFVRAAWEVQPGLIGRKWHWFAKGGEYEPYYDDIHLVVNWANDGREISNFAPDGDRLASRPQNLGFYGREGITYPDRTTSDFSPRVMPAGIIFSSTGFALFPQSRQELMGYLGMAYTRPFKVLVEAIVGGGDSSVSGSAARHYRPGVLNALPNLLSIPSGEATQQIMVSLSARLRSFATEETTRFFSGFPFMAGAKSIKEANRRRFTWSLEMAAQLIESNFKLEAHVWNSLGLAPDEDAVAGEFGPHPASYPDKHAVDAQAVVDLITADTATLVDKLRNREGGARYVVKKSYIADRQFELCCHIMGLPPRSMVDALRRDTWAMPVSFDRALIFDVVSALVGVAWDRFDATTLFGRETSSPDPFLKLPPTSPAMRGGASGRSVLVSDIGHPDDIGNVVFRLLDGLRSEEHAWVHDLAAESDEIREWLRKEFFNYHVSQYSKSRRKAPIYWQLATASAGYSVWLYIHAFSKDTLFRVQNDYVTPKLAHEQRRLESLTAELRDKSTPTQRKELAAQESFVDELRGMLDEVKRVAPLWNPNLDDGVIINFAPLWRLVPQHKAWQKELRSTWDALCDGKYDWAHLAMHLWPERVVPKCATDRSFAIAHGLEDVFWIEGTDGKWTARKTPTRPVADLIAERTSAAVKSALASLLEAPAASGTATKTPKTKKGKASA